MTSLSESSARSSVRAVLSDCSQWGQKVVRLGNCRTHLLNLVLATANPALNAVFNIALAKQLRPRGVKDSTTGRKALKLTGEAISRVAMSRPKLYPREL